MPTASPRHRVRALPALFLSSLLWTGAVAGCAREAPPTTWQPGNLQPLTLAWQQFFSVQWTATPRSGTTLIEGYITNTWGFVAQDVRVLVNGFDSSGSPVGQMIAWGPNDIEPGGSKYFDVTVPSGAATYDVSVFSWKWKWPPSGGTEPRERRTSAHARAVDRREP